MNVAIMHCHHIIIISIIQYYNDSEFKYYSYMKYQKSLRFSET